MPYGHYHATVRVPGFAPAQQDLSVHGGIPVTAPWQLSVAASTQTVTVESDAGDMVQNTPTPSTTVSDELIARLPTENSSSGLSSVITLATPGVAQDSNGMFHPQGEHADTTFSIDGQPISDQQSRLFSNQLALGSVQSLQVISGVAPAEYGDKASLVVETTTKSGISMGQPHGAISGGYGSFGTTTVDGNLGFGSARYGSFTSIDGLNSGRFLDSPEFRPIHDHGNTESIFERLDTVPSGKDSAHINISLARSWAQTPNQYDQAAAGQDQRQQIKSFNVAPSYTHLFNPSTLVSAALWVRQDQVHYYPSHNPFDDTPVTLAQNRRLTNLGGKVDLSWDKGISNFKAGAQFQHTPLAESFTIGITDPAYNAPCLDGNGNPVTNPALAAPCAAPYVPNPRYLTGEAGYDLTRGGHPLNFHGTTDIKEEALYFEDQLKWRNWTASVGLRGDNYNGITTRSMVEPRFGASYNVARTGTILRGSYGKFFLTPYNENLIVSSETGSGGLANNLGAFGAQPLKPAKRNHFAVGFEQPFGRYLSVTGDYFWKYTDRDFDFDVLINSPLAFPIQWSKSKIDGFDGRINLSNIHGITAYAVLGHTRSRFFGPESGGIIFNDPNTPLSGAPFRIDHDQAFQQTTHLQWQPGKEGLWYAFNWTYESGLVAGNAPFAADTTTPVSLTYLSPDQQAQAAITCGGVRATIAAPLTSCAPAELSSPLLQIPAPGTENADRNPPRVAPRNMFDMTVGYDNVFRTDHYKANLSLTAVNISNQYSLYNFLSTFSGTHFVAPRNYTGQLTFVF